MRLLVIEDDGPIAAALSASLRAAGFAVDVFDHMGDGEAALHGFSYDALVLDRRLPDGDGLDLVSRLRAAGRTIPILVLTARDATEGRVSGLDRGADDYMVKPFETSELLARIRALLRRPGSALGVVLQAGDISLQTAAKEVQVGGRPVQLSRREIGLLEELMRSLGRVVPKGVLEERLYGLGEEVTSNSIEVLVHRLRRKLETANATAQVHTVRGVGYFLADRT